jgi:hypothetical protein
VASNDSDPEHGIYRVQHIVRVGDAWHICISDLIFDGGVPVAVLDWGGAPDRQYPLVTQRLDPQRLSELPSEATDFLYDGPIEDPRKVH